MEYNKIQHRLYAEFYPSHVACLAVWAEKVNKVGKP